MITVFGIYDCGSQDHTGVAVYANPSEYQIVFLSTFSRKKKKKTYTYNLKSRKTVRIVTITITL